MNTTRTGIDDPTNVLGLADLIKDTDDITSEVDIGDLEKQIVNRHKGKSRAQPTAPDLFKSDVEHIMKGMDLPDDVSTTSSDSDSDDDDEGYTPPIRMKPKTSFQKSKWFTDRTEEERTQGVISRVLGDQRGYDKRSIYDQHTQNEELEKLIAQEQEQDLKASLLAQYDLLRTTLTEDRVDLSNVPQVTEKSPIHLINASIRMLRHKNDLRRFVNLGEDFILMLAAGLESAFDGKTKYFGYFPDLSGWSDNVKPRIRRMRADTSTVVSSVMNGFNMGALTRIGLELVPSLVLYSRTKRSKQRGEATESEWKDSIRHIEDIDRPKK